MVTYLQTETFRPPNGRHLFIFLRAGPLVFLWRSLGASSILFWLFTRFSLIGALFHVIQIVVEENITDIVALGL
jgi:hypothetical protein